MDLVCWVPLICANHPCGLLHVDPETGVRAAGHGRIGLTAFVAGRRDGQTGVDRAILAVDLPSLCRAALASPRFQLNSRNAADWVNAPT